MLTLATGFPLNPPPACSQGSQQLRDKTAQMDSWTSQHDQAMHFLMSCLEDVKSKIVTVERPDSPGYYDEGGGGGLGDDVSVIPGSLEDLGPEQRERVLGHLLERLQVFTKVRVCGGGRE